MQRIRSFSINHDILKRGMYISRIDGDVITYDIRMKEPNKGDYLENASMHTIEHLFATYARNSKYADKVIYFGPMGCRTGFYFLLRDSVSAQTALDLTRQAFKFIADFEGEIPGTLPRECGNYREHDLEGAKEEAVEMINVLSSWDDSKMNYRQ